MAAAARTSFFVPVSGPDHPGRSLSELASLGSRDIETPFVADLSADLHSLFDPIAEGALPIYFGPLLGRLYLEGL